MFATPETMHPIAPLASPSSYVLSRGANVRPYWFTKGGGPSPDLVTGFPGHTDVVPWLVPLVDPAISYLIWIRVSPALPTIGLPLVSKPSSID